MKIISYTFFFLLFISCEQKETFKIVSVDEAQYKYNLSDLANDIAIIPLETTDECLLDEYLTIKMDKNLLFIMSNGEIYLFNQIGEFIKQLTRKGEGPDEVRPNGFTLDTDKKLLVTYTDNAAHFFKYDGTFIRKVAFDGKQCLNLSYDDNYYWMKARTLSDINNTFNVVQKLIKYDADFIVKDSLLLHSYESVGYLETNYNSELSIVKGKHYIHVPTHKKDHLFRDTVYLIENNTVIPQFKIDYGNMKYTEGGHPMMAGYPISLYPVQMSSRFILSPYFEYSDEQKGMGLYIFDRVEEKGFHTKDGIEDDLYHTGQIKELKSLDLSNEQFYYYKTSEDLETLFPDRPIDDNCVVFIVHLKK